jgi:hypothetical protein
MPRISKQQNMGVTSLIKVLECSTSKRPASLIFCWKNFSTEHFAAGFILGNFQNRLVFACGPYSNFHTAEKSHAFEQKLELGPGIS